MLLLPVLSALLGPSAVLGQQFAGQYIGSWLPATDGAQVAFFNIRADNGFNTTLINYFSYPNSTNQPLNPEEVQRAVIILHGSVRDAWNYFHDIQDAIDDAAVFNPDVKDTNVAILSPYWANTDDITAGWPLWNETYDTNALLWSGTDWGDGYGNVLPTNASVSSFSVIDQLVLYFDDRSIYPNLHEIVIAGHSRGAQMLQRYAAVGKPLHTRSPIVHWVGNPNSFLFLNSSRPVDPGDCTIYNDWPAGLDNYTIPYEQEFVQREGSEGVIRRYYSKQIAYARGLNDFGDLSDDCRPYSTGANRGERLYNFLTYWPPNLDDTVDYNTGIGHNAEKMVASASGVHRVFLDNFNGNCSRSADFGPRQIPGDDPHPVDTGFA